jgi:VanZ family protein
LQQFFRRYWLPVSWGVFILVLTGLPGQYFPQIPTLLDLFAPDKLVHFFIFGMFVFTLMKGFIQKPGISIPQAGFYAIMLSIGYGGITELLQAFVFINRQGSIYDFIANGIGSIIGFLVCFKWKSTILMLKDK